MDLRSLNQIVLLSRRAKSDRQMIVQLVSILDRVRGGVFTLDADDLEVLEEAHRLLEEGDGVATDGGAPVWGGSRP